MANSSRDAIIEVSARIATLRTEQSRIRADLRTAESELDALLANVREKGTDTPTPKDIFGQIVEGQRLSLNQQIVDLLDQEPLKVFSAEDVLSAMSGQNQDSVRSALVRLADAGRIYKPSRGHYQSIQGKPEEESMAS